MSYESWRISYQSSEAAARAAYATTEKLHAELTALRDQLAAVGAGGVEPLRKARAASAETKISALMSKISTLVDKRLSCEPCAEAEEDLLQLLRTRYAAPAYPAEGVPVQAADAQDAARWREAIKHVGAEDRFSAARYVIRGLEAPRNVMRGSVAGHFTKSIDAALAAQAKHEVQP